MRASNVRVENFNRPTTLGLSTAPPGMRVPLLPPSDGAELPQWASRSDALLLPCRTFRWHASPRSPRPAPASARLPQGLVELQGDLALRDERLRAEGFCVGDYRRTPGSAKVGAVELTVGSHRLSGAVDSLPEGKILLVLERVECSDSEEDEDEEGGEPGTSGAGGTGGEGGGRVERTGRRPRRRPALAVRGVIKDRVVFPTRPRVLVGGAGGEGEGAGGSAQRG